MGLIGADPRATPANTTAEKIARAGGGGVAAMIAPEAEIAALVKAGAITAEVAERLLRYVSKSAGLGDVAASSTVGAAGGAGGEAAAQSSPPELAPLARTVGTVAGGGVGLGMVGAAKAIPEAARGIAEFTAPMSQGGREAIAGRTLESRAENPTEVRDTLANAPREIVPGSKPTTFQVTGDIGLGALEREQQTRNPQEFMQRRAEQNAARIEALQGIQPTGSPAEVANTVRGSLRDIDTLTHGAVERATQEAQGAAQAIGGQGVPEQYGASLRGVLQDAENTARTRERALWNAVDPDGTLTVGMAPVRSAVDRVYGNLTAAGQAGLTGTENSIRQVVGTYKPTEPFREIADLRSAISSAMRHELSTAGRSPAYARLSALRGAVESSISGAVEQRATHEAQAVARGEISPEQTIAANLRRQIDEWRGSRAEALGGGSGSGAGGVAAGRTIAVPSDSGAACQSGWGSSNAPGDQRLQENDARGTFDAAARERLGAANAATRERVATYKQGPVGQVLRPQGERGQYRIPDPAVAGTIFKPGPGGYESVQAFRRATDDPTALQTLQDYVASRLRQVASRPDGTLDPTKTANWLRAHSEAMRAFPELEGRFRDAATATSAIEDVATLRKQAMDDAQRGTLGKLINARDDADVTKIIGGVFSQSNPMQAMRQIAAEAQRNPDAHDGLRKSLVDYMYGRFISNTEAATSGVNAIKSDSFQGFIRQNRGVLRQALSEGEVNALTAIAADLNRAARSLNAVRIPGQSNTAQDVVHELAKKTEGHGSLLTQIILAAGGGYAAHGVSGALTAITGILGKNVVSKMREAGMEQVGDLVKRAMLDPDLARQLLAKVPAQSARRQSMSISDQLRRFSAFGLPTALSQDRG